MGLLNQERGFAEFISGKRHSGESHYVQSMNLGLVFYCSDRKPLVVRDKVWKFEREFKYGRAKCQSQDGIALDLMPIA